MKSHIDPQDEMIPDQVGAWKLSESNTYSQDNLFEYINGGAELYISFGFSNVYSHVYTAVDQPGIILDVFSMNSARDAFGVFSFSSETSNADIGQGAYLDMGVVLFWQDQYYISIMSYPETPESREAIMSLARTIESNIGTRGKLPGVLSYLPEEGLVKESIRYFHHSAWINTHYYISDENIFLIDSKSNCVLARYGDQDNRMILLLIDYHDPEVARAGYQSFVKEFIPELDESGVVKLEDGTFTGCKLMDSFLAVGFNGSQDEDIIILINSAIELFKNNS
ncbi:MAG: hypothetical protein ISS19_13115 [Bacteroidales bacterium]|nr:hypothetical protein [Bacteroidales bacterium]